MIARNILTLSLFTISYVTVSHAMIPRRTLPLLQNHAAPLSQKNVTYLQQQAVKNPLIPSLKAARKRSARWPKVDERKRAFHNVALFTTLVGGTR